MNDQCNIEKKNPICRINNSIIHTNQTLGMRYRYVHLFVANYNKDMKTPFEHYL